MLEYDTRGRTMSTRLAHATLRMTAILLTLAAILSVLTGAAFAQGGPKTHVVKEGENLTRIAEMYGVTVDALLAANRIDNPDLILVGTELVIPAEGPTTAADGQGGGGGVEVAVYVVQPRDTIDTIAQMLNVDPTAIIAANFDPDDNPGLIFPGQTLLIPSDAGPYTNRLPLFPPAERRTDLPIAAPDGQGGGGIPAGEAYVVQPGDMLDSLAQSFDVAIESIIYANDLSYPYILFPGQTLLIPADAPPYGVVPPNPAMLPSVRAAASSGIRDGQGGGGTTSTGRVYVVREGDTILSIVLAHDIALMDFLQANTFLLNAQLEPGVELTLP